MQRFRNNVRLYNEVHDAHGNLFGLNFANQIKNSLIC